MDQPFKQIDMSSFADEQEEEIEVLQSIFPTEFEQLESKFKFKIHLKPGSDEVHGQYSAFSVHMLFYMIIEDHSLS